MFGTRRRQDVEGDGTKTREICHIQMNQSDLLRRYEKEIDVLSAFYWKLSRRMRDDPGAESPGHPAAAANCHLSAEM